MSFQPLSREEIEKQVASAEIRMKPSPYCVTDMVIVQMWDMIRELEDRVVDLQDQVLDLSAQEESYHE